MKNIEIATNYVKLQNLAGTQLNLPVKVGYNIVYNRNELGKYVGVFQETRNNIITKYSPDGKVKDDNPNFEKCQEEITELENEEIEVKLRTNKLEDFKDMELSLDVMDALSFMIEE